MNQSQFFLNGLSSKSYHLVHCRRSANVQRSVKNPGNYFGNSRWRNVDGDSCVNNVCS